MLVEYWLSYSKYDEDFIIETLLIFEGVKFVMRGKKLIKESFSYSTLELENQNESADQQAETEH